MNQENGQNPYEVVSDPEVEVADAKGENPVPRIVVLATVAPIITLFSLSFFIDLEVSRFSSEDLANVVFTTSLGAVIATLALPVVWAVAGFIFRRNNVPTLTHQEAVIFVLKWIGGSVLLFATLPSVIEGFGSTFPISEYTISYFLLLALAMIFLVVTNFLRYRREPNQKSAFMCCLGGIIVIMAVGMVGLFIYAIAASALT